MSKEIQNHILSVFQVKQYLGSGAYGYVWRVAHRETGREYALKKIFDAFQNDVDAQRTYREVSILHQMNHENIVKLEWVIKSQSGRDLYLVFEFVETDLHSIIGQSILGPPHIRFITFQLCKVLKYLHSAQLIHRDLKSSNILINSNCEIKLCDFGLVRSLVYEEDSQLVLSEDVATRWYRSPEMLLGSKNYGAPTDMWSLGCVLAEVIRGEPMFPGNSSLEQLQKVLEFTGIPNKQKLRKINSDLCISFLEELNIRKKPFKHYLPECDKEMKELIVRMLDFDPSKRITAEEVLQLPCMQEFRKGREKVCQSFIMIDLDDNKRLDLEEYRKMIYQDVERRYPLFNKITPMPRIYRAHRSLNHKDHKDPLQSLAKTAASEFKNHHSSTHTFKKSHLATNLGDSPSSSFYKKSSLVSIYKGNKENLLNRIKDTINEENESMASKIFKKKAARRNMWRKEEC